MYAPLDAGPNCLQLSSYSTLGSAASYYDQEHPIIYGRGMNQIITPETVGGPPPVAPAPSGINHHGRRIIGMT